MCERLFAFTTGAFMLALSPPRVNTNKTRWFTCWFSNGVEPPKRRPANRTTKPRGLQRKTQDARALSTRVSVYEYEHTRPHVLILAQSRKSAKKSLHGTVCTKYDIIVSPARQAHCCRISALDTRTDTSSATK